MTLQSPGLDALPQQHTSQRPGFGDRYSGISGSCSCQSLIQVLCELKPNADPGQIFLAAALGVAQAVGLVYHDLDHDRDLCNLLKRKF